MKRSVKIAIIGASGPVLAAIIAAVVFLYKNDSSKSIHIENSQNVVTGKIDAKGDVTLEATRQQTYICL